MDFIPTSVTNRGTWTQFRRECAVIQFSSERFWLTVPFCDLCNSTWKKYPKECFYPNFLSFLARVFWSEQIPMCKMVLILCMRLPYLMIVQCFLGHQVSYWKAFQISTNPHKSFLFFIAFLQMYPGNCTCRPAVETLESFYKCKAHMLSPGMKERQVQPFSPVMILPAFLMCLPPLIFPERMFNIVLSLLLILVFS